MRDLYLKRNELCRASLFLRSSKFRGDLSKKKVECMIEEQNKIWKKYIFYKNYLKEIGGKK